MCGICYGITFACEVPLLREVWSLILFPSIKSLKLTTIWDRKLLNMTKQQILLVGLLNLKVSSSVLQLKSLPIPVPARSKAWVCGRSPLGITGSNPVRALMSVCCECCVLSDKGLWDGLIDSQEDSYRVWCVWVWSWSLQNGETLAH